MRSAGGEDGGRGAATDARRAGPLTASEPLQPQDLVITLLGTYVRPFGDTVWSGGLVALLGELGLLARRGPGGADPARAPRTDRPRALRAARPLPGDRALRPPARRGRRSDLPARQPARRRRQLDGALAPDPRGPPARAQPARAAAALPRLRLGAGQRLGLAPRPLRRGDASCSPSSTSPSSRRCSGRVAPASPSPGSPRSSRAPGISAGWSSATTRSSPSSRRSCRPCRAGAAARLRRVPRPHPARPPVPRLPVPRSRAARGARAARRSRARGRARSRRSTSCYAGLAEPSQRHFEAVSGAYAGVS